LAKRLVEAEVLAVNSICRAVADAAMKDILQLLGRAETDGSDQRRHGDRLIEVLTRPASDRVNRGPSLAGGITG
jgi:hypothetical protein